MRNTDVRRCTLIWLQRLSISFFLCLGLIPAARAQNTVDSPAGQSTATGTQALKDSTRIGQEHNIVLAAQHAGKGCP